MHRSKGNMSSSLLSNEKRCYRCGTTFNLHKHHIYAGGYRNRSERYGAWCYLCFNHHVGADGVHTHKGASYWLFLKAECQAKFEEKYSHERFMEVFGKDWIYIYDRTKQQTD